MKKYFVYTGVMLLALILSSCATTTDPKIVKENLSKTPIGVHVERVSKMYSGPQVAYLDIMLKNNSGQLLERVYVEVFLYNDNLRVGMANHIFSSVNPGEVMVQEVGAVTGGRKFNDWRSTYKILN